MPTTCFRVNERSCLDARTLANALQCLVAEDFQSPFDAAIVHLLNASGATIIGKTNCDEFGMA